MGGLNDLSVMAVSSVLVSLRITPVFLFAPPFTLTRVPKLFLWFMGLGLSATLITAMPPGLLMPDLQISSLVVAGISEFSLGLVPVLAFMIMFGALQMVGRTIDIQSGFGLALLIDPTSRTQLPMVGTLFAYMAAATFFAMDGHHEMLRYFAASYEIVPLGGPWKGVPLSIIIGYIFVQFILAFGIGAITILILFVADLSVAMLSRTVPQMNALILGVQVKALLLIVTLPIAVAMAGTVCARLVTEAFHFMARAI